MRVSKRAAAIAVAAIGMTAAPAYGADDPGGALTAPPVAPVLAGDQGDELPAAQLCDLPPKDTTFDQLGRNPGPRAVAHHAGGQPITDPAVVARAPSPELYPTGDFAFEPNLGVTKNGTLFVDDVTCEGSENNPEVAPIVVRSTNGGRSFQDVSPRVAGQRTHATTLDPYLYVDKRTDRVFSNDILVPPGCDPFSVSADRGTSWTDSVVCGLGDHANIFTGPPPAGGPAPLGYPDVVYYCAIDVGIEAGISKATSCEKSLDGGVNFVRTGEPAFVADPQATANDPLICDGGTGPGFVDEHGTVYLPRGLCGVPMLAISHDEGATWTRVKVADNGMGTQNDDASANLTLINHEAGVVVDHAGNIYYTWVAHDRLPYMSVSRDGGKTWSPPAMIGPPGVRQAWNPAIDIGSGGRIALAYIASTNAPVAPAADGPEPDASYANATWNGYITVTDDAAAPDPTYYTASVNAPSDPFVRGRCGQIRCGPEFDFIDSVVAGDGTPWAVMVDACAGTKCLDAGEGEGVVARLVPPPGA